VVLLRYGKLFIQKRTTDMSKAVITIAIRLRYDDTTTYSTTTEVIEIVIRLRYDYDPTTTHRTRLLPFVAIRREQKMNMPIFRRSRIERKS